MRLVRMVVLLVFFVLGAYYVLGLSRIASIFAGATCAYIAALVINRMLSQTP